jgi:hypothetical protein
VPLIVSVKPPLPVIAELGFSEVMTGYGGPIVKLALLETSPPDSTVTVPVPGEAMRFAGTDAVNWVELTKAVANADPFHATIAPLAKPLPFTVTARDGNG